MNILNGGAHADNSVDFQEFMILPIGAKSFNESIRMGVEVFQSLKSILIGSGHNTNVGDEGGFAPSLKSSVEALDLIMEAITTSGFSPGEDIMLGLDAASSEFYSEGKYKLSGEGKTLDSAGIADYYLSLIKQYPIYSIEDGMAEDDWDGWKILSEYIGNDILLVGDDLFVTDTQRLKKGIEEDIANSILIKFNQIGTLTETLAAIEMAHKANYTAIISHRSGETEDVTISDIAVATNARFIKSGSLSRSDRLAKYNQLMRIEENLGLSASYAGKNIIGKLVN